MARAITTVVGLAIMLAFVLGVASTAFGKNGDSLLLGVLNNSATAVTKLTGIVSGGPALHVANNTTTKGSRALQLNVAAKKPPLTVNATAGKAINLNADKLDGKDSSSFLSAHGVYAKTSPFVSGSANDSTSGYWSCDSGDKALSGGYELRGSGWEVASDTVSLNGHLNGVPAANVPADSGYYYLPWRDTDGTADSALMKIVCLDMGTPHQ